MDAILRAFPPNDFVWLWAILAMPLMGAAVNAVWGRRLGRDAVTLMSLAAVGVPFLLACVALLALRHVGGAQDALHHETTLSVSGWQWAGLSLASDAGQLPISASFTLDSLSCVWVLLITSVALLAHIYSSKCDVGDADYPRYCTYLNLLVFSMLVLVLADNLVVMFLGWQAVSLGTYLVSGFDASQDDKPNALASKVAVFNRIGDFGLFIAIALILSYCGRLDWSGIAKGAGSLSTTVDFAAGVGRPLQLLLEWLGMQQVRAATLVGLFLLFAASAKSGQLPLFSWLPDYCRGPVSGLALIHSVATVSAGVYLVCRTLPLLVLSPTAMFTMAIVAAVTAVWGAIVAVSQRDIKKILAYSTVSQMGLIFLALSVGAFSTAIVLLIAHACIRSCMFLCAGSALTALRRRIVDPDAARDIRNLGGLRMHMPITFASFLSAWFASVLSPSSTGYALWVTSTLRSVPHKVSGRSSSLITYHASWPPWGDSLLLGLFVIATVVSALQITRLLVGVFFGQFRGWRIVPRSSAQPPKVSVVGAKMGTETTPAVSVEKVPVTGHALDSSAPAEPAWQLTLPTLLLGALSLVFAAASVFACRGSAIDPIFAPAFWVAQSAFSSGQLSSLVGFGSAFGLGASCTGVIIAWWAFSARRSAPAEALVVRFPGLHRFVLENFRLEEFYRETISGALEVLSDVAAWLERVILDGVLARTTAFLISAAGASFRLFQTGRVQSYATLMVLGVLAIGAHFVIPHAYVTVRQNAETGRYTLTASGGLGYAYRWDADGDGHYDSRKFGSQKTVEVVLMRASKRAVRVQAINALGRVAERTIYLERPREDKSHTITRIDVYDNGKGRMRGEVQGTKGPAPLPSSSQPFGEVDGNKQTQGNTP